MGVAWFVVSMKVWSVVVLLTCSLTVVARNAVYSSYSNVKVEEVNASFIQKVTAQRCLLMVHNLPNNMSESLLKIFGQDENEIKVVVMNKEPYIGQPVHPFVLYPKRRIDRTCLMSPDAPVTSKSYSGPKTIDGIVQFVNQNCGTFRASTGVLTPPGLLRKEIMHNLFRLQKRVSKCIRVKGLSEGEFFWEYLSRSQPVVIEGGAKNWKAMSKWTSEYLRKKYYNKKVHVKLTERGEFEGVEPAYLWPDFTEDRIPDIVRKKLSFPDLVVVRPATADMEFSEFIDLISVGLNDSGISAYLEYSSIPYYMPDLEDDIQEPLFGNLLNRKHLNMWLSDGNTLGKLHFDPFDNFLCQISGVKDLVLFEPHSNENLYEAHIPEAVLGFDRKTRTFYRHSLLESTSMVMSPVDILKPNFKRFPNFSKAKRLECTIQPGDILFMPAFWWHEVQSYPDSREHRNLAVNFWYEPLLTKEFPCVDCKLFFNSFYENILHNPPK